MMAPAAGFYSTPGLGSNQVRLAYVLKKEDIHGKRLINLDSGGETVTTVSSSGGARARITCPLKSEENDLPAYFIGIRGLLGGHSGNLINQERGNANLLAVRILKELQLAGVQLNLVSFSGGLKYNAIPREADIVSNNF